MLWRHEGRAASRATYRSFLQHTGRPCQPAGRKKNREGRRPRRRQKETEAGLGAQLGPCKDVLAPAPLGTEPGTAQPLRDWGTCGSDMSFSQSDSSSLCTSSGLALHRCICLGTITHSASPSGRRDVLALALFKARKARKRGPWAGYGWLNSAGRCSKVSALPDVFVVRVPRPPCAAGYPGLSGTEPTSESELSCDRSRCTCRRLRCFSGPP